MCLNIIAQGWPAGYGGVMLQGFYWDSFDDSQWNVLEKKANDFSGYFDLVWVPQSGKAAATSRWVMIRSITSIRTHRSVRKRS